MTAAEKAMADIGDALELFYDGAITAADAIHNIALANGAYSVERIGDGK